MGTRVKMLSPKVTVWWLPLAAVANPTVGPVSADMDADAVNISCAIVTGYTLGPTDSDTDDTKSICDSGNVTNFGPGNFEANLTGFREDDVTSTTGVYYLFFNLFKKPDAEGYLIQRIGKLNTAAWASGDVVSWFHVSSDNPADIDDGSSPYQLTVPFIPQGDFAVNVAI